MFSNLFRVISVPCIRPDMAMVTFANKFHAAQVVLMYNKKVIKDDINDDQFTLNVKSTAPAIQTRIEQMTKKRAGIALLEKLDKLVV